ncbi:MAG: tRNA preQ1(34) S-adenosylmethionine ribosyltransferase-isomerase QueA [Rhodospirillales bacterium]|nr:tRNA preQ1(34) S-adenosylmethionine ribosyltransferase-isomerase QueA [Rhodospirillales bacterium]MBO6785357.1 tRNA preQ1(34) S-adenosylmethionine ribosyltransferase-isomerase QueA [Rhodospirillales bacterium]
MDVSLFDFHLPQSCIAQCPARPRDAARMLHVPAAGGLSDLGVRDLPGLLNPGDVMVFNDTRVIPARLTGKRGDATNRGKPDGGAKVEVTLHQPVDAYTWRVFAKPAKKLNPRDYIVFAPGFAADCIEAGDMGERWLRFNVAGRELIAMLEKHGIMPLPPYIKRSDAGDDTDRSDYQTMFAEKDGAVAAPTAALHFTDDLLAAVRERGVTDHRVTLHVGAGTFLPVRVENTDDHVMHTERAILSAEIAEKLNAARAAGGRIIACGTTSLRTLESAVDENGRFHAYDGNTDLFITPGYRFKGIDALMTNFHLPCSTLFMLVSALAGLDRMQAAYAHAIDNGYRFYSYGDACFIERAEANA